MRRRLALAAGLGGASLLSGCASVMEQSYIASIAPGWFEEKAVEVKGEGYPKLRDIPEVRPFEGSRADWETGGVELKSEAGKLESKAAAEGPVRTDEEVRASAAQLRAQIDAAAAAADKASEGAVQGKPADKPAATPKAN